MRYAILGDIHSNWDALDAVLRHLDGQEVDRVCCVGDVVGYGAQPDKCTRWVRENDIVCVAGNHDRSVVGKLDLGYFNRHAREAVEWTRRKLSIANAEFLAGLPLCQVVNNLTLVHSTVNEPDAFGYIETVFAAQLSFHAMSTPVGFIGHSHVPIAFMETGTQDSVTYSHSTELDLRNVHKTIINVGSVGQPRDDDPRACCCVYDSEAQTAEIHRVEYPVEVAQTKIRRVGLPELLAARLELGR